MSKNTLKEVKTQASLLKDSARDYVSTPYGKALAVLASVALIGGGIELSQNINVREDKAKKEQAALNRSNFFRYTMLNDINSLKSHGACADELMAEANYYSRAAKIVGPDYGIYEGNRPQDYKFLNDNAKIYKKSAQLALKNEISCFPANSKMSSLTPHFELNNMVNNHLCVSKISATPVEEVYSKPTKLERDMASAKNVKREIAINLAKNHNVPC